MAALKNYFIAFILSYFVAHGYGQSPGSSLSVTVLDGERNKPTPVRIRITDSNGHAAGLPAEVISIMYGRDDKPERYGYQPDSSFYADGFFHLELSPGTYHILLSKGAEYLDQAHAIDLKEGEKREVNFEMHRWMDMNKLGWYSADDHIHIRRSPRENPLILKWVEAEGLNVGVMLQMGDFWTTYFSQYAFGQDGVYKEDMHMLSTGQEEPRTHEIGHTIAMVADDFVRYRNDYYYYDKVFDKVHELNGIMGYAHQGMSFNGFRGMTLDVLAGKVDFLELLQFCVDGGPLLVQNYYHFLDLGYKITATAGSDFPWCGNGPRFGVDGPQWNSRIGNVRFYTYIDGAFEYDSWKESLSAGHTFVSSGPGLLFDINGKLPGDEINLSGQGKVTVHAQAFGNRGQVPLSKLEIIAHGKVVEEVVSGGNTEMLERMNLDFEMEIDKGMWIAARCYAGPTQVAHTTPIYVSIDKNGFYNPETLHDYLALNEKYLQELEYELEAPNERVSQRAWWYKKGLKQRIEDTRKIIDALKSK
ncbi:MAG: CehA/McbA family metallohydrolase [Cytophagales bacterium]|nr:CehA/McbA family metallohydrolase [Cytophagales bacterium]